MMPAFMITLVGPGVANLASGSQGKGFWLIVFRSALGIVSFVEAGCLILLFRGESSHFPEKITSVDVPSPE